MAESVKVLPDDIKELIDVHEWDMRTREGVQTIQGTQGKIPPQRGS